MLNENYRRMLPLTMPAGDKIMEIYQRDFVF